MKKVTLSTLILSLTLLSLVSLGSLANVQVAFAIPHTDVDVATAYDMITGSSYPDLVVLDVRTQSEYDTGHIYGSVWIPHTELESRIEELAGHEDHEIIVYCKSGFRSEIAANILDSYNFSSVFDMTAGFDGWQSAGHPVWIATVHNLNTTWNYDTIQAAVDALQTLNDHLILVDAGTYNETVVIDKSVSLIGENKTSTVIDGGRDSTTVIIEADNASVREFTIKNGRDRGLGEEAGGISIEGSGNTVADNIVSDNDAIFGVGGVLVGGSDNTVANNLIANNQGDGISIVHAANNTISGNIIIGNQRGIDLVGVNAIGNLISGNHIMNNTYGMYISALNNTIERNTITANEMFGLSFDGLGNNTISANTISKMTQGVRLASSNGNKFFHNSFINNTLHVNTELYGPNTGGANIWDDGYPSGGNYWSNHTNIDVKAGEYQTQDGSDGIGDMANIIDVSNIDSYPLMGQFHDFNATSEHNIQLICNSSITDFEFNGTAISFNVSGEDGTTGFCRIRIPTALMNGTYLIIVNGTEVDHVVLEFSDSMYNYLYFTYSHSTQNVTIIPEFQALILTLLTLTILTVALAISKKGQGRKK